MAMDLRNRPEVISELQRYLRDISRENRRIGTVVPDGSYGPETESAVRDFQNYYGLSGDGSVDQQTWDAIYDIWRTLTDYRARSEGIYPFDTVLDGGAVRQGESFELVYMIQIMLDCIAQAYNFEAPVEINGLFDENTYRNVQQFQRANGLPENGVVDKSTWNMLAHAYNKYNRGAGTVQ